MNRPYRSSGFSTTSSTTNNFRRTSSTTRSPVVSFVSRTNLSNLNLSNDRSYPSRTTTTTYRSDYPSPTRQTSRPIPITIRRSNRQNDNLPNDPKVTVYSLTTISHPDSRDVMRKSSLPIDSDMRRGGLIGLQNLGNTCFMNSVLQCLSNTKPLLSYILNNQWENDLNSTTSFMKGVLMQEYANLIRQMWLMSEDRTVISPSSFKDTIGTFAPRFTGYAEQDSQEFLRYLLQGLHEDVNRVRRKPTINFVDEKKEEKLKEKDRAKLSWERCLKFDNSHLVDIFAGQLKSTLECSRCGYKSITFDMFWDLSIPLPRDKPSTTVQECLQLFMSKEELTDDEEPTCDRCKQKRPCTKKFSIQKCPKILVLHLKRFSQSRYRSKLNTSIDYPLTNLRLDDLNDVISESHEGVVPSYNLFGISNHSGTLFSGHYIAKCKHPFTHEWHEFNDAYVHSIDDDPRTVPDNAYVLFYEQNKR